MPLLAVLLYSAKARFEGLVSRARCGWLRCFAPKRYLRHYAEPSLRNYAPKEMGSFRIYGGFGSCFSVPAGCRRSQGDSGACRLRYRKDALRAVAWRRPISRVTSKTDTSAGLTPAMREAWPRVSGRMRLSFSLASFDRFSIAR